MDITSAFKGITTPLTQLYDEVQSRGWMVQDISISDNSYKATVKNPHGEKVEKVGRTPESALAACLTHLVRKEFIRQGRWQNLFTHKLPEIAESYAKAPVFDPKAAPAWKELAQDSMARMAELQRQGLHVEVVDDPEPYHSTQEMADDIHKNKHVSISRANSEHPLWTEEQNVAFRTVHDVMGHAVAGGDFGWHGENLACAAHFPLLSPNAQRALFTECVGQTAYGAHYRGFGPQKVTFLDDHFLPVQGQENSPGHMGEPIHQTRVPEAMPAIVPSEPVGLPSGFPHPHALQDMGLPAGAINYETGLPRLPGQIAKRLAGVRVDPNAGYETGIDPPPNNAYLEHDPVGAQELKGVASKMDTGWSNFTDHDGKPDHARMEQVIINAFRAALLSPRKELKWNAAHYQDISHIGHNVTDPKVYWDALENARINHNRSVGVPNPEIAHKDHYDALMKYYSYYQHMHPGMSPSEVKEHADREVMVMQIEETKRLEAKSKDVSMDILEPKIYSALDDRLRKLMDLKPKSRKRKKTTAEDMDANPYERPDKYGAFMGTQLIAIAKISRHSPQLLEAALEDVKNHDGAGHHFRQMTLSLGIPYVGPKVASFAWLILQPMTSQLATIDTHIADVLGYNGAVKNRDYFKLERQLQAGRDATGYNGMPLGQFQWGMWDMKRTGEGTHQDHSPLKAWSPQDWRTIGFHPLAAPGKDKGDWPAAPEWWLATQQHRDAVGDHFDNTVAHGMAQDKIPWGDAPVTRPVMASDQGLRVVTSPDGQGWVVTAPMYGSRVTVFGPASVFECSQWAAKQHTGSADGTDDEVHLALDIPENIRLRLYEWAQTLSFTDKELEPIEEYHVTIAYAEHGVDDADLSHILRTHNLAGLKLSVDKLDKFGDAVVLRLKSDARQFQKAAEAINSELEELGVEVTRYDGGWKPHITLAYSPSELPPVKAPPISFRTPGMSASVPRKRDSETPPWQQRAATIYDGTEPEPGETPEVIEPHMPGMGTLFGGRWDGRMPIIYHKPTNKVYIGAPANSHGDLKNAAGLAQYDEDPENTRFNRWGTWAHGWVGFNPEARGHDEKGQRNYDNFGWYDMNNHPGPHVDKAIADHLGFDPGDPPENMSEYGKPIPQEGEDNWDDVSDSRTANDFNVWDETFKHGPDLEPQAPEVITPPMEPEPAASAWAGRLAVVYHKPTNKVYIGAPGRTHFEVTDAAQLGDQMGGRSGNGDVTHGWVGFNPEAKKYNLEGRQNYENFGWYNMNDHPGPHVDKAIAEHLDFDPEHPPENMSEFGRPIDPEEEDNWDDVSDSRYAKRHKRRKVHHFRSYAGGLLYGGAYLHVGDGPCHDTTPQEGAGDASAGDSGGGGDAGGGVAASVKTASELPAVNEVETDPYENMHEWMNRRPFVYDRNAHTVHLGPWGSHHGNIRSKLYEKGNQIFDGTEGWIAKPDNGDNGEYNFGYPEGVHIRYNNPELLTTIHQALINHGVPEAAAYPNDHRQPEPEKEDDWLDGWEHTSSGPVIEQVEASPLSRGGNEYFTTPDLMHRRPYYYHPATNTVYLGPNGAYHAQIQHHVPDLERDQGYVYHTGEVGSYDSSRPEVNRAIAQHLGPPHYAYEDRPVQPKEEDQWTASYYEDEEEEGGGEPIQTIHGNHEFYHLPPKPADEPPRKASSQDVREFCKKWGINHGTISPDAEREIINNLNAEYEREARDNNTRPTFDTNRTPIVHDVDSERTWVGQPGDFHQAIMDHYPESRHYEKGYYKSDGPRKGEYDLFTDDLSPEAAGALRKHMLTTPEFQGHTEDTLPQHPYSADPSGESYGDKHEVWSHWSSHHYNDWGHPCTCTFYRGDTARTANKLHDHLMNPKQRSDLQTPEGQSFLNTLDTEFHNDKTDAMMPWLTREWKKGRIKHRAPEEAERHGETWMTKPALHVEHPDGEVFPGSRRRLTPDNLDHWADFYRSSHPIKREMGDIMQHDVHSFRDRVRAWEKDMEERASQKALEGGDVVHKTPDGWTVRNLTTPEELKAEGDAMGHCVGGYHNDVESGRSIIHSLRDPKGVPHATVEFDPSRHKYDDDAAQHGYTGYSDIPTVNTTPVPHGGEVVQIQGKGNQVPKPEYQERLKHYFTHAYSDEDRPIMGCDEGYYDSDGYHHSEIDHPDHIEEATRSADDDPYGLGSQPLHADYDSLMENIGVNAHGWYDTHNGTHVQDIYDLAKRRQQIPELAHAAQGYSEKQQDSLDNWAEQNWEHAPHWPDPDMPHGHQGPDGDDVDPEEGKPYWMPHGSQGERFYDHGQAEKEYESAQEQWEEQHPGTQASNHMQSLLRPHWDQSIGQHTNEGPQPVQQPAAVPQPQAQARGVFSGHGSQQNDWSSRPNDPLLRNITVDPQPSQKWLNHDDFHEKDHEHVWNADAECEVCGQGYSEWQGPAHSDTHQTVGPNPADPVKDLRNMSSTAAEEGYDWFTNPTGEVAVAEPRTAARQDQLDQKISALTDIVTNLATTMAAKAGEKEEPAKPKKLIVTRDAEGRLASIEAEEE